MRKKITKSKSLEFGENDSEVSTKRNTYFLVMDEYLKEELYKFKKSKGLSINQVVTLALAMEMVDKVDFKNQRPTCVLTINTESSTARIIRKQASLNGLKPIDYIKKILEHLLMRHKAAQLLNSGEKE